MLKFFRATLQDLQRRRECARRRKMTCEELEALLVQEQDIYRASEVVALWYLRHGSFLRLMDLIYDDYGSYPHNVRYAAGLKAIMTMTFPSEFEKAMPGGQYPGVFNPEEGRVVYLLRLKLYLPELSCQIDRMLDRLLPEEQEAYQNAISSA